MTPYFAGLLAGALIAGRVAWAWRDWDVEDALRAARASNALARTAIDAMEAERAGRVAAEEALRRHVGVYR